jgi:Glycosyl transferases group 1
LESDDIAPRSVGAALNLMIVGPDFHGYNDAIGRSFEKHDFRVTVVDTPMHNPTGLVNRLRIDLPEKAGLAGYRQRWRQKFNARVLRTSRGCAADMLLVIKGDWIDPQTFLDIPARLKVIWFQDIAMRCGPDHIRLAQLADAVFVFEATDIDYLAASGVERGKISFLPMGFDPQVYFPQDRTKDVDVSFVGKMHSHREEIIARLVRDLPDASFEIWGRYIRYQVPGSWLLWLRRNLDGRLRRTYLNADIPPAVVNTVYNRSRIVLNIHHGQSKLGCNPRVFEIAGSGAFQICDDNSFVRDHVSDRLVQFENYDELLEKIRVYLADDAGREAIAKLTHAASHLHSFDERIKQLLGHPVVASSGVALRLQAQAAG